MGESAPHRIDFVSSDDAICLKCKCGWSWCRARSQDDPWKDSVAMMQAMNGHLRGLDNTYAH